MLFRLWLTDAMEMCMTGMMCRSQIGRIIVEVILVKMVDGEFIQLHKFMTDATFPWRIVVLVKDFLVRCHFGYEGFTS